jgi:hypothetical protein
MQLKLIQSNAKSCPIAWLAHKTTAVDNLKTSHEILENGAWNDVDGRLNCLSHNTGSMPPQRRPQGPRWHQGHRDCGIALQFVRPIIDAGNTPDPTVFLASDAGRSLSAKWGTAKVRHNVTKTAARYQGFLAGGNSHNFTAEQRALGGLETPERNPLGLNINPGDDGEDLGEDDDILGPNFLGDEPPPFREDVPDLPAPTDEVNEREETPSVATGTGNNMAYMPLTFTMH